MKNSIKITISVLATAIVAVGTVSAQLRSSYFMKGSTQRYDLNPALTPQRGYVNYIFTNFTLNAESNYLQVDNLFYPNADNNGLVTFMHKDVSSEDFLGKMPDMNTFDLNFNDRIIGMGSYTRNGFWSFNVNLRSETSLYIPKDFFAFLKNMSSGTEPYDISGMGFEHNDFIEVGGGYTFPFREAFTVGFRAKALFGLAHAAVNVDKMTITMNDQEYRVDMDGTLEANVQGYDFSGLTGERSMDDMLDYAKDFKTNFGTDNISSIGFAIDAGIDWMLLDRQINLSASVTDLGYNIWSAKNSYTASVSNLSYAYTGYDFAAGKISFEKPENIKLATGEAKSVKTPLHATFNLGFEYNAFDDALGLGVLYQGKKYPSYFASQVMAAVTYRPSRWFSMSVTESFINSSLGVIGTAFNIHSGGMNLFLGLDYLAFKYGSLKSGSIPIPLNQNKFNLTFGMSIPLKTCTF